MTKDELFTILDRDPHELDGYEHHVRYLYQTKEFVRLHRVTGVDLSTPPPPPTDEEIQRWGEEYADEYFERSDNPLSEWWLAAEAFTNGGRAVLRDMTKNKERSDG